MSFIDHLEELRWSLFKGIGGLVAGIVVCVLFRPWIQSEVLLGPLAPDFFMYRLLAIDAVEVTLLNRTVTGQFFADIGMIVAAGFVLGSPVAVYYMWKFVEPALYPEEKENLRFSAAFASGFFLIGVAFGYLVLTPIALQFFADYQISPEVINEFDISRYFNLLIFWTLGTGVLFELPVAVYLLTNMGLVTPDMLRSYRKYALMVVLVLAAFFTPPDPISQIIVALPLLLLYEISIYISILTTRRNTSSA
ncbi:MAG: twin-arginine translocase subunit TatC [Bacteroidetes bacterium QS_8_68_15]|nr:MAG: twin-arginine translocase subunit TatC [Bacteroidetes bacterium QS_8_68_15]